VTESKNRKIIILDHNKGGRLANQLWSFISVYAYCLEKKYECQNYSFFKYAEYFNIPISNFFVRIIFFNNLIFPKKLGILNTIYQKYITYIKKHHADLIVSDKRDPYVFYLPPSRTQDSDYAKKIDFIERSKNKKIYLDGWLFRNPIGIEKYRKEITDYFKPRKKILKKIDSFISPLRKKYDIIIGVHIRQGDYTTYKDGELYFSPQEVRLILNDYIKYINNKNVLFLICSDEKIDENIFKGLNFVFGLGEAIEDLYSLSKTDLIIGSNSTYGAFAAYYGNIPIIVFERPRIEWAKINLDKKFNYYNDCTTVHQ